MVDYRKKKKHYLMEVDWDKGYKEESNLILILARFKNEVSWVMPISIEN